MSTDRSVLFKMSTDRSVLVISPDPNEEKVPIRSPSPPPLYRPIEKKVVLSRVVSPEPEPEPEHEPEPKAITNIHRSRSKGLPKEKKNRRERAKGFAAASFCTTASIRADYRGKQYRRLLRAKRLLANTQK